jgi:hypothetical protein
VLKLSNINFESSVGNYNKMRYNTYSSGDFSQGDTYFDSLGLIGYNGYAQGDNLETYSCDGTPFVEGPNAIVIPTSLFTHTELHHYIETDQLEETPLYSAVDGLFEMISVERDDSPDKACGDVDYVFIRYDISPGDAMAVLNMVLQGMVEETLDENNNTVYLIDTVNEYLSSKLDGIRATLLNLPYASLGYIPWTMPYVNSPTGPEPHPADPWGVFIWIITWIIPILHVIVFAVVNMLASDSTGFMANFAKSIFMKLMTALGNLLWLIIRAAILVLAWLIFAIALLLTVGGFLLTAAGICCILALKNIECSMTLSSITTYTDEFIVTLGYECNLVYIDFFDIEIPSINLFYKKDSQVCMDMSYNIYNSGLNSFSNDDVINLVTTTISSDELNSNELDDLNDFFSGCGATMAIFGSTIGILGAIWSGLSVFKDFALLITSILLAATSLSLFIFSSVNGGSLNTIAGIGIGLFASACFGFLLMGGMSVSNVINILTYISLGISIASLILTIYELLYPESTFTVETLQIFLGIATLICGTYAVAFLTGETNDNRRSMLGFWVFYMGLFCGIGLLAYSLVVSFMT